MMSQLIERCRFVCLVYSAW